MNFIPTAVKKAEVWKLKFQDGLYRQIYQTKIGPIQEVLSLVSNCSSIAHQTAVILPFEKLQDNHHSSKNGSSNLFGDSQIRFQVSALKLFKQLRQDHSKIQDDHFRQSCQTKPTQVPVTDWEVLSLSFRFQFCSSSNC